MKTWELWLALRLHKRAARMTRLSLAGALAAATLAVPLLATPGDDEIPLPVSDVTNVNARFTVERVTLVGWTVQSISHSLRTDLDRVVGQKLDHSRLELLAGRLKKELRVADVSVKVAKGSAPEHVIVTFEVIKGNERRLDLEVAKFLYNSAEGWSGEATATTHAAGNTFMVGLVSDGDVLVERFTGIRARFERKELGAQRLGLSFEFDNFHDQWNPATLAAAQPASALEIYQDRQVFSPEATLRIAQAVELDFGTRFSRIRLSTPATRTESSNGVVTTLRYHPRWGSAEDPKRPNDPEQEVDAYYSVEAATHALGSDADYTRHYVRARYRFHHVHNLLEIGFLAGRITGIAPLFDRFVLGNSSTLRGWDKYEIDPLGGSHVVHGSIDYTYRWVQAFYDTGAIWDRAEDREQRQSLGVGLKKDNFQLAVAFPVHAGHADPVFYAGMNF